MVKNEQFNYLLKIPFFLDSDSFIVKHLRRKVYSLQEKMCRKGRCRSHPPCLLVPLLEVTIPSLSDSFSLVLPRLFSKFPKNNSSANTRQPQNDGNMFISLSLKRKANPTKHSSKILIGSYFLIQQNQSGN